MIKPLCSSRAGGAHLLLQYLSLQTLLSAHRRLAASHGADIKEGRAGTTGGVINHHCALILCLISRTKAQLWGDTVTFETLVKTHCSWRKVTGEK
jgi:hypothetical protein